MVSLAFTWTLFAFGEELIFRGYLMNRITDLVGHTRSGWGVALLLASAIFGLSHFMQGITGVSENFIDGMILGALYLKFGRTLTVPIIAHRVTDTVDFLLVFFITTRDCTNRQCLTDEESESLGRIVSALIGRMPWRALLPRNRPPGS